MKIKIWYLVLLIAFVACEEEEENLTFFYSTYNGEVDESSYPMPGVTVKAYSSSEAWYNNDAPIKTFTTDSEGKYISTDKFYDGTVFFAEELNYNNWPRFLSDDLNFQDDGTLSAGALLYVSFLQDIESVSDKTFLISDVLLNDVSMFSSISDCSKDNYIMLSKDLKLMYNEGSDVCDGQSQQVEYDINITRVNNTTEVYLNNHNTWQFGTNWDDAGYNAYITKDFTKIMFKTYTDQGDLISVYSLQN